MSAKLLDPQIQKDLDKDLLTNNAATLIAFSRRFWVDFGFSGSLVAWHAENPKQIMYPAHAKGLVKFLRWLEEKDIDLQDYAIIMLSIAEPYFYESPGKLYTSASFKSWALKLRNYAQTAENFDLLACVLNKFFELQIEYFGYAYINRRKALQKDPATKTGKYLGLYHRLLERVLQCKEAGIDPEVWLEDKFLKVIEYFKVKKIEGNVDLCVIVNRNGLEPQFAELKVRNDDPWREIKDKLGLSRDCQITNGSIPKGWAPSTYGNIKDIVKIYANGVYFMKDGSQYRGKRHYAQNAYFTIKCLPENFREFWKTWNDPKLLSATPTWEEYSKWALDSNLWDEQGNPLTRLCGKSVKWRIV